MLKLNPLINWPSLLKWRLTTSAKWPENVIKSFPVSTSYSLEVLSILPDASNNPFGSNDKHTTYIVWPFKVWILLPFSVFQIFTVLSNEPVAILSPNGKLNCNV